MAFSVSIFRPTVCRKGRKTKGAVWWAAWRDEQGRLHRISTKLRDRVVAKQAAAKLERELGMGRLELDDPYAEYRTMPLAKHLDDFHAALVASRRTDGHVKDTSMRVRKIIAGCGFKVIGDIAKAKVEVWLSQRKLSMGKGKGKPISVETRNHFITALKHFITFLVENRRLPANDDPLIGLKKRKTDGDRRYVRRALTWDQFQTLITVAQRDTAKVQGLLGVDRAMVYLLATCTGYRRRALRRLRVQDLDLDQGCCVTLPAAIGKGRRETPPTPLRPEVAESLHRYIAVRGRDDRLFPGLTNRTAEMLRHDLVTAGIPAVDDQGRVLDLHSLRYSFNAEMRRRGVELSVRQKLMHHTTPELTANTYGAVPRAEFVEAVAKLPVMPAIDLPPVA